MRFRVEHEPLADAVAWVARALPARPVVPILSGLRLEAGKGLKLSCFDYELAASADVPADVTEPGTVLVPGRLLAEITRSLPGQPAEFSSDGDEVALSCGSAEFSLVSLPLADYPALPEPPSQAGQVDGGELATAIGQVLPAASRDDTLPILTAICLDADGDVLTLAATDRYRMAVREVAWEPARPGMRAIALVPARTLADAARIMTPGVPVTVAFAAGPAQPGVSQPAGGQSGPGQSGPGQSGPDGADPAAAASRGRGHPRPAEGMISFTSGGRRLTGRLMGGEYIRYRSRFPAEFGGRAEVPAASFIEAVRRVSLVADRASPVLLTFGSGRVVIEAHADGRARAVERVTASFHGDEPSISFNPHYLLDGLTAAAADAGPARHTVPQEGADAQAPAPVLLRLQFTSPAKPALITRAIGGDGGPGPRQQAGQHLGVGAVAGDPVAGDPVAGDPVAGDPVAGDPVAGDPVAGDPVAGDSLGDAPEPGGEGERADGPDAPPRFRYLVVPLRPPARA